MTIILGIDPGSQRTGFGLISAEGGRYRYVTRMVSWFLLSLGVYLW